MPDVADPTIAAAQAVVAAAPAPEAAPAAEPATAPEAGPAAPGPAPWAKSLETRFADPEVRAQVDAYLREEQQPYITKIEAERAEAQGKTWVFDKLEADPEAALREIVAAVWDDEAADRVAELVAAGYDTEGAIEQAGAEAEGAGVVATPAELPADVKETVEWAKAERARQAEADKLASDAAAMEQATTELNAWADPLLESEPDIHRGTLMAYVAACRGDMAAAHAAYREAYPAPVVEAPKPPPLLGGHTHGGIEPSRRFSSLAQAAGSVFDAASSGS